ncbi:MAG: hypothetical protein OHK0017_00170 [Patescibacteria group bacterium]
MARSKKKNPKKGVAFLQKYNFLTGIAGVVLIVTGLGIIASQTVFLNDWFDSGTSNSAYAANFNTVNDDQNFETSVEEGGDLAQEDIIASAQTHLRQVLGAQDDGSCDPTTIECKTEYTSALEESRNGSTQIIVDKTAQKMVMFRNGEVIENTVVTTGRKGFTTPSATFYVNRKLRNIYLKAPAAFRRRGIYYNLKVKYWMGLSINGKNTGYGIHDAYWRSSFGGSDYAFNGSHGCVNTPLDVVGRMYDQVPVGTKIVIF